ncbi:hypothetical protein N0V90_001711 [Kalmusia sp. IMI 367209]|nr:hypothetical protein N0V90_001711 [Kalmusia sp. IMI 367209]
MNDEYEKKAHQPMTYKTYVKALCSRNPSLQNLASFLSDPNIPTHGCRVAALDFKDGVSCPDVRTEVKVGRLDQELHEIIQAHGSQKLQGRILVIEDLTKNIVELLGTSLGIDPLFFAMHLHVVSRSGMRHQTPDQATLPSRLSSQKFTNMSYHRAITCDTISIEGGRLQRDTNIDRKLIFLPSTTIGLVQHCLSVIHLDPNKARNFWLALVLVDPAISYKYYVDGQKRDEENIVHLPSQPFLGLYEDFLPPPPFIDSFSTDTEGQRGSLVEDLQYYWTRAVPECFDATNPSLQAVSYYPLKIVAAEWVKYVAVMHHCLKKFEYQHNRLPDLDQFNIDLGELQAWGRRAFLSQSKVEALIRLLRSPSFNSHKADHKLDCLAEDLELILHKLQDAGRRLENTLPIVMTSVQIADTRRTYAEQADIKRLTVLALVFVPLTFIASLFSMNTENMPGSKDFWVYFAVAIPVTLLVVLIARPPVALMRSILTLVNFRNIQNRSRTIQRRLSHIRPSRSGTEESL